MAMCCDVLHNELRIESMFASKQTCTITLNCVAKLNRTVYLALRLITYVHTEINHVRICSHAITNKGQWCPVMLNIAMMLNMPQRTAM